MPDHVILLSVPGLRGTDLNHMPNLTALTENGARAPLVPSFPCVTWPVQANILTGKLPGDHGVVANGFYWRDRHEVEMWTAENEKIQASQIWDLLHQKDPQITSAVWFPMLSKRCGADYVCMPAPIHNPDGTESLWCYTKPTELYGELRDKLDHFPLQHFWGPLAHIKATRWIVDSGIYAARKYRPNFFYLYLPHLDYAAQKEGPDSDAAMRALGELDETIGTLVDGLSEAYSSDNLLWLVASEYVITPVDHVCYPNRALRREGLLQVQETGEGELLDFAASSAWAMVDHQFSHVFVKDGDPETAAHVGDMFRGAEGIAEVLVGEQREKYHLVHERAGDVILISTPNSWQAYYWWLDDDRAPSFARNVDIHRKPGYDPVELHFDFATKSTPLDATLIRGSHGAPAASEVQQGVLLCSEKGVFAEQPASDIQLADLVLQQFDA